jgi:hypothetical protein
MPALLRLLSMLAVVLTLLTPALAQDSPYDDAGPYGLPLSRRSLGVYTGLLKFDKDQLAAAKALHDQYRADFRELTKEAAEKEKGFATERPQRNKDRTEHAEEFVKRAQGLEQQLLQDLRALCTEEQGSRFAGIERARRRETGGRLAIAAGDGIDLVLLLDSMKAERTPEVGDVLQRWELDVDRAEQDRDRMLRSWMSKLVGDKEPEEGREIQKFLADLYAISSRRRDATRRTLRELEPLLAESHREQLGARVREISFPRIYTGSPVLAVLDKAERLGDLTPEQTQQLTDLRATYTAEAAKVNARWAAATEEKQAQMASTDMEVVMQQAEDPKDAFGAARAERRELDRTYVDKITGVLTEEQRARVPQSAEKSHHGAPEFLPPLDEAFEQEWEDFQAEEPKPE